jgi:predicted nucleotidyltransferase
VLISQFKHNAETINPQINQLLSVIVGRLVQEFSPESIFLFGSHIWGTPHADSDLDLLMVVSDSNLSPSKRSTVAYRCLRDILYPLDILVRTRKEIDKFAQVPMSLEYQILFKGKCIYG